MSTPRMAARIDWAQVGAFLPERFEGEQRREYEDEAFLIEQEWDQHH